MEILKDLHCENNVDVIIENAMNENCMDGVTEVEAKDDESSKAVNFGGIFTKAVEKEQLVPTKGKKRGTFLLDFIYDRVFVTFILKMFFF